MVEAGHQTKRLEIICENVVGYSIGENKPMITIQFSNAMKEVNIHTYRYVYNKL